MCILLPVLKLAPIIFCFRSRPLGLYRHLYTPLDNHPSHGGIISTWRRPQTPWRRRGTGEQLQASSGDTTRPTRARGWAPRFVSSFLSTDDKFPLSCYISASRITRTRERRYREKEQKKEEEEEKKVKESAQRIFHLGWRQSCRIGEKSLTQTEVSNFGRSFSVRLHAFLLLFRNWIVLKETQVATCWDNEIQLEVSEMRA